MKDKIKLYILGAGGLGREVLWNVQNNKDLLADYEFIGFLDDLNEPGKLINNVKVVGGSNLLLESKEKVAVIIAIGDRFVRKEKFDLLKTNENIVFPNLIGHDVTLSDTVNLGKGNIILHSAKFSVNIDIGDFNLIYISDVLTHDVKLGNYNSLYTGVIISGESIIKDFCELGTGAIILPRLTVESNTIIGAGAVVIKDTAGNETLVGVPAKKIK